MRGPRGRAIARGMAMQERRERGAKKSKSESERFRSKKNEKSEKIRRAVRSPLLFFVVEREEDEQTQIDPLPRTLPRKGRS